MNSLVIVMNSNDATGHISSAAVAGKDKHYPNKEYTIFPGLSYLIRYVMPKIRHEGIDKLNIACNREEFSDA